jgi:ABC-type dipeptide/oligopeptide/nickel transport system permease component
LTGQLYETDPFTGERQLVLRNLLLPAVALGVRPLAIIMQLTRSSMLDVLSQDYIRTARAKGLSPGRTVWRHALRNALNPVVTAVSGWLASLMAGAFFIEYIFNWKGLGTVTLRAVENLDFPVVMGATLFVAAIFVLVNIGVDMLYALLDPRVKIN